MGKTTIQISTETRDLLKSLRITRLETYDEIILRLIKQLEINLPVRKE